MIHRELRRVLVTGASRALGAPVACKLAEGGYRVFLATRNEGDLRDRAGAIERDFSQRCNHFSQRCNLVVDATTIHPANGDY